jgi:hypothetical protein
MEEAMLNVMIVFWASLSKPQSAVTESFEARPRDFIALPSQTERK